MLPLHSAAAGHRATRGGDWESLVQDTQQVTLVPEFEFRERKGA